MCMVSAPPSLLPVTIDAAPRALIAYAIPVIWILVMLVVAHVLHKPLNSVFSRQMITIWLSIWCGGFLSLQWGDPLLTRVFQWERSETLRLYSAGCQLTQVAQTGHAGEVLGYGLFWGGLALPLIALSLTGMFSIFPKPSSDV